MNYRTLPRLIYSSLLVGLLSACAVAPSYYYTLSATDTPADRPTLVSRTSPYAIDVTPVVVPAYVDRPQIVVNEQGNSQVVPLRSSLWASPLSSEIRNALSNALVARLGAPAIASSIIPENLRVWRVTFEVLRFESVYENHALMDASWQLTPINQGDGRKTILCRASAKHSVGSGVSALVQGHDQALQGFADAIAAQINGQTIAAESGLTHISCT
jgi:uncharacterized lipoprotein YmbA